MDLGLYDFALEGGGAATKWARQHESRKRAREAKKRRAAIAAARKLAKAEDAAELKKRRAKYFAMRKERKRLGLSCKGLPPRINKTQIIDLTGQRFGRLTVIRQAPTSKNRGKNRCCYVKCDCPRRGVYLVAQTNLRQGLAKSCGCLVIERLRARKGEKRSKPLSIRMLDEAARQRGGGNVRLARMLELAAPSVRISERKRQKRKARAA
jgi:hypothetical protein